MAKLSFLVVVGGDGKIMPGRGWSQDLVMPISEWRLKWFSIKMITTFSTKC